MGIIAPTFEKKRNIYARCGFLTSQFSPIEIKISTEFSLFCVEDMDFLSSNVTRNFTSDFFKSSGGLKIA